MSGQYVGANGAETGTTGGNSLTVGMPNGLQEGDELVLLASYVSSEQGFIDDVAGWTSQSDVSGSSHASRVWTKVAGASESDVTVTVTGTDPEGAMSLLVAAYRGFPEGGWRAVKRFGENSDDEDSWVEGKGPIVVSQTGLVIVNVSCQLNTGTAGVEPNQKINAYIRQEGWGQRQSFNGVSNLISDRMVVSGEQTWWYENDKNSSNASQWIVLLKEDLPLVPRVRSNTSDTVGSLLEATDAPALESNIREAFFEDEDDLPAGTLYSFIETLAPGDVRTKYYPNPTSSQERLAEYVGSTILGRMADAYPSPIRARATDLVGTSTMTAQQLLSALFERWQDEFPWFFYELVPDLRYRVEGDDYTGDRGTLTVEGVLYTQDEDTGRRLSIRQILDEILSIFPGTGIVQTADGEIGLRPTYGPDAPDSAAVVLDNSDVFSVSTGDRPDPRRVYNRARVTSRGYEFQADQAIITDSFMAITDVDDTALRDTVSNREHLPGLAATIPYEKLVDTSQGIDVTYTAEIYSMNSDGEDLFLEGSETDTITLAPGSAERIITVTGRVGEPFYTTIRSEWGIDRRTDGINVRLIAGSGEASTAFGQWWIGHILKVDATGDAFVQRNESITARFGYDLTESEIINSDGQNVLEQSQFKYGEREISISTDAFALTEGQAQEIAQGLVLHHITPRVVRTVEQSWSSAYKVLPDHIGLLVQLPSGAEGVLEERSYTDDYSNPLAPLVASTFRATLTEPVARDPTETNPDVFDDTDLLAFDSGAWLRFDDGTLVEQT